MSRHLTQNLKPSIPNKPRRLISVAPMMDWTDRHCRYFHRQITKHAWLYTEMVTTDALIHGDQARHLDFDTAEHPLALQIGGSDPHDCALAARLAKQWAYDEINLNCGCPSDRVQKGAFGACLMQDSQRVADIVKAMKDASDIDVTVKHRTGIDQIESYTFLTDFVGALVDAGCKTFIVHARNAWLQGLSPKENREIPPLRYEWVYQLKKDFPDLEITLNGGINSLEEIDRHLQHVDGVMLGRIAYHDPFLLSTIDQRYYQSETSNVTRLEVIEKMVSYIDQLLINIPACKVSTVTRHMLGLTNGLPGARRFRQILSDPKWLAERRGDVLRRAYQEVLNVGTNNINI